MKLPICWCGDPGTYGLESVGMVGVGPLEDRWWRVDGSGVRTQIVTRCRSHAGPFGVELLDDVELEPCVPLPVDAQPWDVALPLEP